MILASSSFLSFLWSDGLDIFIGIHLAFLFSRHVNQCRSVVIQFRFVCLRVLCFSAPHDNNKYILKYKIYRGRGASLDEQIDILKEYLDQEY
jgi:hypothetical protein